MAARRSDAAVTNISGRKTLLQGTKEVTVPCEEAPANYASSRAKRRGRCPNYSRKELVGGSLSAENRRLNRRIAVDTGLLEARRKVEFPCSGEMRRYRMNTSGEGGLWLFDPTLRSEPG